MYRSSPQVGHDTQKRKGSLFHKAAGGQFLRLSNVAWMKQNGIRERIRSGVGIPDSTELALSGVEGFYPSAGTAPTWQKKSTLLIFVHNSYAAAQARERLDSRFPLSQ